MRSRFAILGFLIIALFIGGCGHSSDPSAPAAVAPGGQTSSSPSVPLGFSFQNIEPFQENSSEPGGIAVDASKNIFVVGQGPTSGWAVTKSTNSGTIWTTVDTFSTSQGYAIANAITVAPNTGNIYVVGNTPEYLPNGSSTYAWVVRMSADDGNTWTTVDSYTISNSNYMAPVAVTADGSGNIYVVGSASLSSGGTYSSNTTAWITRKSANNGMTWTTVDTFELGVTTIANSVAIDSLGRIYVAGYGTATGNLSAWTVRESSNSGTSWSTIDSFQNNGDNSEANGIGVDKSGNIFVSGFSINGSNQEQWLVRESSDGGKTWGIIDGFDYGIGGSTVPGALTIDSSGNIYVVGYAFSTANEDTWIIRQSTDSGVSWSTIDSYSVSGSTVSANAITTDSSGGVYAAGTISPISSYNPFDLLRVSITQ